MIISLTLFLLISFSLCCQGNVSYDGRSFIIDGKRELLIGGCIHYPRMHYSEWASVLHEAKDNGINIIETYVFWDIHEPSQGEYYFPDFPSNDNIVEFIKEVQRQGLYLNLRFGPYTCAEWNYGGLPVWVRDLNVTLRSTDELWMDAMTSFVDKTIEVVQNAKLFADDGGPIIMAQMENEYGNIEVVYGREGAEYVNQVADYALSKQDVTSIPWIMCQQGEGVGTAPPETIINTCNGHYCDNWIERHAKEFPNQPHMWTENWPGWFQKWSEPVPHRPASDVSFSVARWIAKGGSYMTYYMAYGGTNFGRSVGGPLIITSYDYDVQINEYGLRAEPKYSHLQRLHRVLQEASSVLLSTAPPQGIPLEGSNSCESHTYTNPDQSSSLSTVTFLSNWGEDNACEFPVETSEGDSLAVPPWSVSIVFGAHTDGHTNGGMRYEQQYNSKTSVVTDAAPSNKLTGIAIEDTVFTPQQTFAETIPSSSVPVVPAHNPLEQLSVTKDTTDYLWYSAKVSRTRAGAATLRFTDGGAGGGLYHVFVNGNFSTTSSIYRKDAIDPFASLETTKKLRIDLPVGESTVDILSVSMGLNNYGAHMEDNEVGIISDVRVDGVVLTDFTHSVGLQGEGGGGQAYMGISPSLPAGDACSPATRLCWFEVSLTIGSGSGLHDGSTPPLAIDIQSSQLTKGSMWVNGMHAGRYWTVAASAESGIGCEICLEETYTGSYSGDRCRSGCGALSQRFYRVPAAWLNMPTSSGDATNTVVFLDEEGGTPDGVQLVQMKMVPRWKRNEAVRWNG